MPKKKGADTTPTEGPPKSYLEGAAGVFEDTPLLAQFLTSKELASLSAASKTTRQMTAGAIKKRAPEDLLTAVVFGNEDLARKIVTSRPELLLDSSAIVTDISGKEIKELTPLQAAICAGDVDMVQMMLEVFYQKILNRVPTVEPESVIQSQLEAIYPNGLVSEKAKQIAKAQEFKTQISKNVFNLNRIFAEINAAQDADVHVELTNPGQHTDSQLNAALHNFRQQFAATSNFDQIFNPIYLIKAFEFYNEQFDNFTGNDHEKWNRRNLFWCQIIGYIQRHLPACLLQAFAQGICCIVEGGKKLERGFEFQHDKGSYMRAVDGDLNNLGYKYAAEAARWNVWRRFSAGRNAAEFFKIYCEQKIRFDRFIYPADPPRLAGLIV